MNKKPDESLFIFKQAMIAAALGMSERNLRRLLKRKNIKLPKWEGIMYTAQAHLGHLYDRLYLH
jgi:hypothetical protein